MPKIPITPLGDIGERHDVPSTQTKWTKLENVIIRNGALVGRPGFRAVARMQNSVQLNSVQPAPLSSITEILNPGSTATGREGYTPATEILRPDSDTLRVTGWAGTGYTELDETTPDSSPGLNTQTPGAQQSIGFANPSTTYNAVFGVIYHIRARTAQGTGTFAWGKLNFYARWGGVNYNLNQSAVISTNTIGEVDRWQDVFVYLEGNAANGNRMLSDADLDNLDLVIEFDSGGTAAQETVLATADGTHTEWTDAVAGDVAVYTDCSNHPFLIGGHEVEDVDNFITASAVGKRQSFVFGTLANTYTSIVDVVLHGQFTSAKEVEPAVTFHYWDGTATEYDLSSGGTAQGGGEMTVPFGQFVRTDYRHNDGLNPADSAAWANADITGGEFGFKVSRAGKIVLQGVNIQIYGEISGGTDIEIDTVSATVMGVTTSVPGKGLVDWTRLMSTPQSHWRLDNDIIEPTVTDVTNSVPLNSTGAGWPVNHAVLYGQVYLVNGVDPTVYYPNGSNVFAELATNDGSGANPLTGRCVAAFGSRILYGWSKDNATVTPERVEYSQYQNGQVHNHRSAGTLDILDTPGGVTALVPLDEDRLALFKEVGVYTLRLTGKSAYPFIRDLVDGATGCTSPKTAIKTSLPDGTSQVFFLGQNETWGYNVYSFNGQAVVPIGNAIQRELIENVNKRAVNITAHASIDPQTNSYWLFVPEGNDIWPRRAWVMDLTTGMWTRQSFPYPVTVSGNWHLMTDSMVSTGGTNERGIGGEARLILGDDRGLPNFGDINYGSDQVVTGYYDGGGYFTFGSILEENPSTSGYQRQVYTSTLETGDIVKPEGMDVVSYRANIQYRPRAYSSRMLVSASIDGGKSWNTEKEYWLGISDDTAPAFGGSENITVDFDPTHAPSVRYRFRFKPGEITYGAAGAQISDTQQAYVPENLFELTDVTFYYETGADDG
jgi:hypothetical protein